MNNYSWIKRPEGGDGIGDLFYKADSAIGPVWYANGIMDGKLYEVLDDDIYGLLRKILNKEVNFSPSNDTHPSAKSHS